MPASLSGYASGAFCSRGSEASRRSRSVRNVPGCCTGGGLPGAGGGGATNRGSATARALASRLCALFSRALTREQGLPPVPARVAPGKVPADEDDRRDHDHDGRRDLALALRHHVAGPRHGVRELVFLELVPFDRFHDPVTSCRLPVTNYPSRTKVCARANEAERAA